MILNETSLRGFLRFRIRWRTAARDCLSENRKITSGLQKKSVYLSILLDGERKTDAECVRSMG